MTGGDFDPGNPAAWRARGRLPEHAEAIAAAWRTYPDLPGEARLEDRMARTRARVAAMRPVHEAMALETERTRVAANFAFVEGQLGRGSEDPRYPAILRARDRHGLEWDEAVAYADGHYAACAVWSPRPASSMRRPLAAAYDLGFRDGGGDPEDLFDTARRALAVLPPPDRASAPLIRPRPLPSDWPKPTDHDRPVRWARRLLILDTRHAEAFVSDLERYPVSGLGCILLAEPNRGFRPIHGSGADWSPRLADHLAGREIEDILVAADNAALAFIDAAAASIPMCRAMQRTRNSTLQQRAQFRVWLARGLVQGETRAAGHICWGKLAKGLYGRLGEFTARYAGPQRPRGHRILVELGPGVPATGFTMPCGRILDPERIISNRSHLRAEMTSLLREFAAALRNP